MYTSYHTHSRLSDGTSEIADLIRAAGDMHLDEVGISDHYVLHPRLDRVDWGMPPDALDAYVTAVQSAAREAANGLMVRLGIEVDYFPEQEARIRDVLSSQPFDYVIGSIHFLDDFPIDEAAARWERLSRRQRDEIIRGYWTRLREMAESGLFDIAGHLDLTKKFGFTPSVEPSSEIAAALDSIAGSGMVVEINTAGWFLPCREAYPSPAILRGCLERGIPIIVTADAHRPEHLVRGYDTAYQLAKEIGYTELAWFSERRRSCAPIPAELPLSCDES